MATSKHIDKICCIIMTATLLLTFLFINAGRFGVQAVSAAAGYASRLFNTAEVHTIDIIMDDWDSFIETCTDEQYTDCAVVIDGESFRNVAIRAKGNTSLSSVAAYGNDRYSFKIEFDHYDNAMNYYGLDKLCLNNIIQDNTYMKDYLTYRLMHEFGVDSPLCSYVYITVNGQDWGLYLAVEGVEESFLARNYGNEYGELYKPDSMKMGGGRGNGQGFDFGNFYRPEGPPDMQNPPAMPDLPDMPEGGSFFKGMGGNDVALIYTDDEFDSYVNIFDNAKTSPSDADKTRLIEALKNMASKMDAGMVIRGLRAITDFEYELQMAQTNHKMAPEVDTAFLTTSLEYSYLSSTTVKEVAAFGGDISQFVPDIVADRITEKMKKESVDV